ncbi:MAG: phosphatidylglycerophosphatase A [Steroidobacteraceae bacterium]
MRFSADPKVVLRDPVHLLAFGFGSGLSGKAPGTMGTLAALPLVFALMHASLVVYLCCVIMLCALGIYICGESARRLSTHDHPGIVLDEFAGMAITMIAVPLQWQWLLLGFLLFRFFDIVKPWPIREADHRLSGGFGIMLDDIIAGIFSCLLLHAVIRFV